MDSMDELHSKFMGLLETYVGAPEKREVVTTQIKTRLMDCLTETSTKARKLILKYISSICALEKKVGFPIFEGDVELDVSVMGFVFPLFALDKESVEALCALTELLDPAEYTFLFRNTLVALKDSCDVVKYCNDEDILLECLNQYGGKSAVSVQLTRGNLELFQKCCIKLLASMIKVNFSWIADYCSDIWTALWMLIDIASDPIRQESIEFLHSLVVNNKDIQNTLNSSSIFKIMSGYFTYYTKLKELNSELDNYLSDIYETALHFVDEKESLFIIQQSCKLLEHSKPTKLVVFFCKFCLKWMDFPEILEISQVLLRVMGVIEYQPYIIEIFTLSISRQLSSPAYKKRKLNGDQIEDVRSSIYGSLLNKLNTLNCVLPEHQNGFEDVLQSTVVLDTCLRIFSIVQKDIQHENSKEQTSGVDLVVKLVHTLLEHFIVWVEKQEYNIGPLLNLILRIIGKILETKDLDVKSLKLFYNIAIMPWNKKLTFCDLLSCSSVIHHSFVVLSWLPPTISLDERHRLFQSSISESKVLVISPALRMLPFFIHRNGASLVPKYLVLLQDIYLEEKDTSCTLLISQALGYLASSYKNLPVDQSTKLYYYTEEISFEQNESPYLSMSSSVFLPVWDDTPLDKQILQSNLVHTFSPPTNVGSNNEQQKERSLDIDLFSPYNDLLSSKHTETKINFCCSLSRIIMCTQSTEQKRENLLKNILPNFKDSTSKEKNAFNNAILSLVLKEKSLPPEKRTSTNFLLNMIYSEAKKTDSDWKQHILVIIGNIASVLEEDQFLNCFVILIEHLMNPNGTLRAISYDQILNLSRKKGITINDLFKSYSEQVNTIFLLALPHAKQYVEEALSALIGMDLGEFVEHSVHDCLPRIVDARSRETLAEITRLLNERKKEVTPKLLLVNNLANIMCFLVMNRTERKLTKRVDFITRIFGVGISFTELLTSCHQKLILKLSVRLGLEDLNRSYQAESGLFAVMDWVKENAKNEKVKRADLLVKHFEMILDHFTSKLLSSTKSTIKKLRVLRALEKLIYLMESHLPRYHLKIMSTVKWATSQVDLKITACTVWWTLVKSLDIETLGSVLGDIVVELLPNLGDPSVISIFNFIFKTQEKELKKYFLTLSFLPGDNIPELKNILPKVEEEPFLQTIKKLLQVLESETTKVRVLALEKLLSLIQKHYEEIYSAFKEDNIDPVFIDLVEVLLIGTRDPEPETRRKCGLALGELGAIDPQILCSITIDNEITEEKNDKELAVYLLNNYLVKIYKTAQKPQQQKHASYAIQEMLKTCKELGITIEYGNVNNKTKVDPWKHLLPEVQLLVFPFHNTDYLVKPVTQLEETSPVYKPHMNYVYWLTTWEKKMIAHIDSPVFKACRNVLKDDLEIAHFLLPQLVVRILLGSDEGPKEDIKNEILAVLEGYGKNRSLILSSPSKLAKTQDSQMATQRIFTLIDYLQKWVEDLSKSQASTPRKSRVKSQRSKVAPNHRSVENLIKSIPQITMANASYGCKAYPRALMHYETHLRTTSKRNFRLNSSDVAVLQKIYAGMNETDCIVGLINLRSRVTLEEQIAEWEANEEWSSALIGYDQAIQQLNLQNSSLQTNEALEIYLGRLRSLQNLGHYQEMLDVSITNLNDPKFKTFSKTFCRYAVQAAWNLGNWNVLQDLLKQPCDPNFDVSVGEILIALKNRQEEQFYQHINKAVDKIVVPLSTSMTYQRAYPFLTEIHMINELKQSWQLLYGKASRTEEEMLQMWQKRLNLTQPTLKSREPILNLRLRLSGLLNLKKEETRLLLETSKMFRIHKQLPRSSYALLNIQPEERDERYHLETAKSLWANGNQSQAIKILQMFVSEMTKESTLAPISFSPVNTPSNQPKDGPLQVCLAKWIAQTGQELPTDIIAYFNTLTKRNIPKSHFKFGRYLDKYVVDMKKEAQVADKGTKMTTDLNKLIYECIACYGRSLMFSNNDIYSAMPRMLTLWLDVSSSKETESELKELIPQLIESILPYQWYISFPQIISRFIAKILEHTKNFLQQIILKVLSEYPQQGVWHLLALKFYKAAESNTRYSDVKTQAINKSSTLATLFSQVENFGDNLLRLSQYKPKEKSNTFQLHDVWTNLRKKPPQNTIMPISQQLILQITDKAVSGFKPFPFEPITISGFSDTVTVLPSLAKPKKLSMIGSNGNSYIFLCKPNDDLRKDCRMMEVNTMLNKLLKKDPDSRQRELRIRTYSVVTLNEDNGLIEWVPNTTGYRHLLNSLYAEMGIPDTKQKEEIKKVYSSPPPTIPEWKKLIQGFFPAVFYKWFLFQFPEPSAWFNARLAYARTAALMSMVGYIVGLGDRHGENILLDSSTGELMHVDFSCLFWKGMKLGQPEKVPFRLTHNMVDALGFTGYEGTFRRVCEISLRLLRHHKEALTSALEAFIYDPLVEWNDKKNDAQGTLADVQERLEGKMRHILNRGQLLLPLGVEGHVHLLIQEATKDDNLCSMYVGWASYL